ncbi:MAG: hypothetical protein JWO05_1346 [Gemmatimonadetes bacterium]|nr:hypothetical protein [Gemmatimonadota bacterium]
MATDKPTQVERSETDRPEKKTGAGAEAAEGERTTGEKQADGDDRGAQKPGSEPLTRTEEHGSSYGGGTGRKIQGDA